MLFDELDAKMRVFETAQDTTILPGLFVVARLDGRGFTKLTKETLDLERPFDERFRDCMLDTAEHLMNSGFRAVLAITQSDEISILMHPGADAFGRQTRKWLSVLAGEGSAVLSLKLKQPAALDCRLSPLPDAEAVVDYFRWRSEDAHRNSLSAHCYWALRKEGKSERDATRLIEGMGIAEKNELLFQRGINFNDLPPWQKRGSGLYWETYLKEGTNPVTGEVARAERRRIVRELELPMKEAFDAWLRERLHLAA